MSVVTISTVRGWDPHALLTSAGLLSTAKADLDHEVGVVQSAMDAAAQCWVGEAADAAAARVAQEVSAGRDLSAAVEAARLALANGSGQLSTTRSQLLSVVLDTQMMGFSVADGGAVTAPALPPVLTAPGDTVALEARNARQDDLNGQVRDRADLIGQSLLAVVDADAAAAAALFAVEVPAALVVDVESLLERLRGAPDALAGLAGGGGAGAVALAASLNKAWGLFGRSRSYVSFITSVAGQVRNLSGSMAFVSGASADATAFARFAVLGKLAATSMTEFRFGQAGGLLSRIPMVGTAAKFAGKAFLPLTIFSGVTDAFTGGGYDGARGLATRGFGLAGASGAGALLLFSASLGPVGLAVAGAAVLAYGVWSLGNYVYDNWGNITDFAGKAAGWTGDRLADAGDAVVAAKDWAGDRLADAGSAVRDAASSAIDTGKDAVSGALNVLSLGFL